MRLIDVKINFDPRILEVDSIKNGDAFEKVPLKAVKSNTITLTGLNAQGDKFTGVARLVTIYFKAKDAGDTKLRVIYDRGETKDSNFTTPKVSDALTKVDTGNFAIGTTMQRSVGAFKRFILKAIPVFIFLIFVGVAAFFAYRWWKQQKGTGQSVFIPEHAPLDQPPSP